jgi:CheY-like chemotaxis protein
MMPVMDGWQFLRVQKQDPALASIPVVVVSAMDRTSSAAAVGAMDSFCKPVALGELGEKVRRHVRGEKARWRNRSRER